MTEPDKRHSEPGTHHPPVGSRHAAPASPTDGLGGPETISSDPEPTRPASPTSTLRTADHTRFGIPRAALQPLVLSAETAVLGTLCFFASSHVRGADQLLVWLAWTFSVASAAFALLFAARSGHLADPPRSPDPKIRR